PLFEEECDASRQAQIPDFANPFPFDRPGASATLASSNDPVNFCEIGVRNRSKQRFKRDEAHGRIGVPHVVDARERRAALHRNTEPNVRRGSWAAVPAVYEVAQSRASL